MYTAAIYVHIACCILVNLDNNPVGQSKKVFPHGVAIVKGY